MKYWFVGGGTGGHVYPALSVAEALQTLAPEAQLTWIGTTGGMEAGLVEREGIPFIGISAGGLHGVAFLNMVRNGWRLIQGTLEVYKIMRHERPAAILTTGGYVSGPVAVVARWLGIPLLVFLPDIEPAKSVKAAGRMATCVATSVEDSKKYFSGVLVETTGYPLGNRITKWTRQTARESLGFGEQDRVLLVFGGSSGARSINRALLPHVAEIVKIAHVIHVSGNLDWEEVAAEKKALPEEVSERYHAYAYLHEDMGAALAAADLIVSRAGAGVLGEFTYFGTPAVLVPYPHAWRYQRVNAEWLSERGAAVVIHDEELSNRIVPVLKELFEDEEELRRMSGASRKLAKPEAAMRLARLLVSLGQGG
ncbi:MAG: undecaprenyldiphospho-muramoylpentapeptide beta-N-acetylglucosaminyltransferase [Anaerolineae bacterium]|nr:undecaprenyldiphospho-muramoylpentapeptide beta-N-acetylglucosaminyltransferase [Anaerolineae bacterium]